MCQRRTSILPSAPPVSRACHCLRDGPLTVLDATCAGRRCNAMKVDGSPFCKDHTCRERGCNKATGSGQYCEDRESLKTESMLLVGRPRLMKPSDRCSAPSCQNPRPFDPEKEGAKHCPLRESSLFPTTIATFQRTHQEDRHMPYLKVPGIRRQASPLLQFP